MLLSKIKSSRPIKLYTVYAPWIILCTVILILTNAFSSLDIINQYNFRTVDVILTYGFLLFWGMLEACVGTIGLVLCQILLEKTFQRPQDLVFRLILTGCLIASWVTLARAIFHKI